MNENIGFDINKSKLEVGDIVILCDSVEAITREFEFWEVMHIKFNSNLVFITGLTSRKSDSFSCDCLKKVDKKYKELIERATPKKVTIDTKHNSHCPICGEIQVFGYYDVNNKYCLKCGQALDWSEQ